MTSAPRSARSIVQYGPARTREKSATSSPDSGPDRLVSLNSVKPLYEPVRITDICPSAEYGDCTGGCQGSAPRLATHQARLSLRLGHRPSAASVTWGTAWHAAQSALMAPAVASSIGRYSPVSFSSEVSAECEFTFSAAMTFPSPSRSGTATDRMAAASSPSVS